MCASRATRAIAPRPTRASTADAASLSETWIIGCSSASVERADRAVNGLQQLQKRRQEHHLDDAGALEVLAQPHAVRGVRGCRRPPAKCAPRARRGSGPPPRPRRARGRRRRAAALASGAPRQAPRRLALACAGAPAHRLAASTASSADGRPAAGTGRKATPSRGARADARTSAAAWAASACASCPWTCA